MSNTRPPTLRISNLYGSPGLVEFTLTNTPPNTLWNQILTYIGFLIRILFFVLALFIIYLLFVTRVTIPFIRSPGLPPQFLTYLHILLKGLSTQSILTLSTSLIHLSFFLCRGYTEEKLTVVRNLKMLVVENSRTRWWGQIEHSTTLVPLNSDGQFWIHELADRFALVVVVDDPFLDPSFRSAQDGMVVVFPTLLPDQKTLDEVWRRARRCLYGSNRLRKFTIEDDVNEDDSENDDE